jgi:hypothetical protein
MILKDIIRISGSGIWTNNRNSDCNTMGSAKTICKISSLLGYIFLASTGILAQDHTIPGENIGFTWNNKHSGSIFDLDPDTGYEIRLRLSDPDGGSEERTVNAHTRPVPKIDQNAEIIELQAGTYDTLFTRNGNAGRPIVYRCIEGKAIYKHIDMQNREWVFIDGLTIINLDDKGIAIQLDGSENCVIRGCTIDAIYGIASRPWKTAMSTTRHALTFIIMIYTGQQMMPLKQISASQIVGSSVTVSPIVTWDSAPNQDWVVQIILSEMPCII